ncbi:MAG: hypothetical protein IT209_02460 [Armatimonadetes bacterium]|nr:hypothetical protein [Armatimonadota bacterium]
MKITAVAKALLVCWLAVDAVSPAVAESYLFSEETKHPLIVQRPLTGILVDETMYTLSIAPESGYAPVLTETPMTALAAPVSYALTAVADARRPAFPVHWSLRGGFVWTLTESDTPLSGIVPFYFSLQRTALTGLEPCAAATTHVVKPGTVADVWHAHLAKWERVAFTEPETLNDATRAARPPEVPYPLAAIVVTGPVTVQLFQLTAPHMMGWEYRGPEKPRRWKAAFGPGMAPISPESQRGVPLKERTHSGDWWRIGMFDVPFSEA